MQVVTPIAKTWFNVTIEEICDNYFYCEIYVVY